MALNRGRHLYSGRRPSRWALAYISSWNLNHNLNTFDNSIWSTEIWFKSLRNDLRFDLKHLWYDLKNDLNLCGIIVRAWLSVWTIKSLLTRKLFNAITHNSATLSTHYLLATQRDQSVTGRLRSVDRLPRCLCKDKQTQKFFSFSLCIFQNEWLHNCNPASRLQYMNKGILFASDTV